MDLYCWPHNVTHQFTAGEVEQIVYALTAGYADAITDRDGEPGDRMFAGEPADEHNPCPRAVLREWAGNPEVYTEHVEQGVVCRRAATTETAARLRVAKADARS